MILLSVILSDNDFETVMNALLNAQHEFNFLHGLRVTDVPDVRYTFELDCSDVNKHTEDAISVLEENSKIGLKLKSDEEETLKKQLLDFVARVSSSKASSSQEILILPEILKILVG